MFLNKLLALVLALFVASAFASPEKISPLESKGHFNLPGKPACEITVTGDDGETVGIDPVITTNVQVFMDGVIFHTKKGDFVVMTANPLELTSKFFKDIKALCK